MPAAERQWRGRGLVSDLVSDVGPRNRIPLVVGLLVRCQPGVGEKTPGIDRVDVSEPRTAVLSVALDIVGEGIGRRQNFAEGIEIIQVFTRDGHAAIEDLDERIPMLSIQSDDQCEGRVPAGFDS